MPVSHICGPKTTGNGYVPIVKAPFYSRYIPFSNISYWKRDIPTGNSVDTAGSKTRLQ